MPKTDKSMPETDAAAARPLAPPPPPPDDTADEAAPEEAVPFVSAPRNHRPWTLRRRLVLTVVALLALVSVIIGVVSVTILRASLQDELDAQLASAVSRSLIVLEGGTGRPGILSLAAPSATDILNGPAQQPGTLALVFDGATITAGYTDDSGVVQPLGTQQVQLLVDGASAGRAVTIDLGGAVGSYRVVTASTRTGVAYLIGLPLRNVNSTAANLGLIIALVSLAGVLVVALLATWIVRLALRPLQRVTETAVRVSELPLDRGEVTLVDRVPVADTDPRTEVGRVGSALNRMLDHVDLALETRQASEHKVRQFVSDASHELRTPLASIRGYAELTRRSGEQLPPDIQHALSRIESESVRMTGLVEDLLLLARLDEGRELEMQPVDLTMLLVDAVSDAHAAGPDHQWDLDLPDEPIECLGDAHRLHQVIANLLTNARTHTPAGTTVTAALSTEGDRALVTVTDDGPGIPTELQGTLFERFARGDSSRFRGTGSTGLGLAIAQAVIGAHHGDLSVESRPGHTCFTVSVPRARDDAGSLR
ncbi:sensor histidine kinase [Glaciibacter psychrotolerans]|uniref:histidine kinase n=1 Tax=Glaciibacter psychrotolerans TaxID=670054 RepID=A0A7Z0J773_9MICO|nr:HAMP domain-containing sensor histidine kinase [Leifsonia psychrotolerans]NYJ20629.1 two-component system OmpR family sensor kinase [Leifsonia psychrotolerans]